MAYRLQLIDYIVSRPMDEDILDVAPARHAHEWFGSPSLHALSDGAAP